MAANTPKTPIYLDYHATTPVDPRVLATMLPWFTEKFGNPNSVQHAHGRAAEAAVEAGRAQVAALIGAEAREIVFTSGATEANNLAIKGAVEFHRRHKTGPAHIVTLTTEHKCVLESCRALERDGAAVTYLPVQADGLLDLNRFAAVLTEQTILVSVLMAHNEIGVIQDIAAIGALCRERGILLHTDAAQAVGKIPIDVDALNVDLLSMSGHKFYAPKGIGVLYVRRRPRARLEPIISGGGQERGLRSGTLPVPLCVGIGMAAQLAQHEMTDEADRMTKLRDRLLAGLRARQPNLIVNGDMRHRLPGNLNVAFPNIDSTELLTQLSDVSVSTGSACISSEVEPSYVLRALGLPKEVSNASIRIGLGRFTTEAEIDYAVVHIADTIGARRAHVRRA
ncbi:MAG: aminotransferase class V-fold PLP-dependent enzyme [Alphaproteobacteria bacterium]